MPDTLPIGHSQSSRTVLRMPAAVVSKAHRQSAPTLDLHHHAGAGAIPDLTHGAVAETTPSVAMSRSCQRRRRTPWLTHRRFVAGGLLSSFRLVWSHLMVSRVVRARPARHVISDGFVTSPPTAAAPRVTPAIVRKMQRGFQPAACRVVFWRHLRSRHAGCPRGSVIRRGADIKVYSPDHSDSGNSRCRAYIMSRCSSRIGSSAASVCGSGIAKALRIASSIAHCSIGSGRNSAMKVAL